MPQFGSTSASGVPCLGPPPQSAAPMRTSGEHRVQGSEVGLSPMLALRLVCMGAESDTSAHALLQCENRVDSSVTAGLLCQSCSSLGVWS